MLHIGFTGTRHGLSAMQRYQLIGLMDLLEHAATATKTPVTLHYGTHEGVELKSDAEAAGMATARAFVTVPYHAQAGEELARNRRLVDALGASGWLIAAPAVDKEQFKGSGTWATIRYAESRFLTVMKLSRGVRK